MARVQEVAAELGIYLVNSVNPFRLEGQKTIMYRMLEALGWETPDWIVVPGGNLGNSSAFGKAFIELGTRPDRPPRASPSSTPPAPARSSAWSRKRASPGTAGGSTRTRRARWFPRFDSSGRSLPAEMLPDVIEYGDVRFKLAPATGLNAVTATGQTLELPTGTWNRVYLLAAANGDQTAAFEADGTTTELTIQDWSGYIGQWDNRRWTTWEEEMPPRPGSPPDAPPRMRTVSEASGITPGYIKRAPVAWFASHRHDTDGTNEPYAYSYLFAYAIDLPAGAHTLTLPGNDRIRILALTVADEPNRVQPAQPLYDTLERGDYIPPSMPVRH